MNRAQPPRHWYRQYAGACPICGAVTSYRERVYGEPPVDRSERYVRISDRVAYDYCMEREAVAA
jgi:hypothetical protein